MEEEVKIYAFDGDDEEEDDDSEAKKCSALDKPMCPAGSIATCDTKKGEWFCQATA